MDETYNIKAIILNRRPLGECNSRVIVYSREAGKLELVARGAKKIKSKLAGHLEPFNLLDIMAVCGQKRDYVGAAVSEKCYGGIKSDLVKLTAAGRALKIVDQLIRPGVVDGKIFLLLKDYLEALEQLDLVIPAKACPTASFGRAGIQKEISNVNFPAAWIVDYRLAILTQFFVLKFLAELGHEPELSRCLNCGAKIQPGKNRFDLARGGLVCGRCAKSGDGNQLVVCDDGIKLLRLALECNFERLAKVKVSKKLGEEAGRVIEKFYKYSFI